MEVPKELRLALALSQKASRNERDLVSTMKEITRLLETGLSRLEPKQSEVVLGDRNRTYTVERRKRSDEVLVEQRASGTSKPFRCSMRLYQSVVKVLATATTPLSVQGIADEVEKLTGDRPEEFRVRVPLRMWLDLSPPLVRRHRARYRCEDSASFESRASAVWTELGPIA